MNWIIEHYTQIAAIAFGVVALARIIVKLTPTPEDDSVLEKIIDALKHIGLHVPTEPVETKPEEKKP